MYYSLNKFGCISRKFQECIGTIDFTRKYKLLRWTEIPGSRERNLRPYTNIGPYENEIYTYICNTYQINIDKCVTFIACVWIHWW